MTAYLFDLDGTLVDSMSLHFLSYQRAFRVIGYDLTRTQFDAFSSRPYHQMIPNLLQDDVPNSLVQKIHKEKVRQFKRICAARPPKLLPLASLLPPLAVSSDKIALVSSGSRNSVSFTLATTGLRKYFSVVVTGDDVEEGKPDPEGYQIALNELGVAATDAIAFEDSVDGSKAAESAGISVVIVRFLEGLSQEPRCST